MLEQFKIALKNNGSSPNTIRNYISDTNLAIERNIIDENLSFFQENNLLSLNISVASKRRMLASIKKYAKFLVNHEIIPQIPQKILTIELPKHSKKIPNITPIEDLKKIIDRVEDPEIKLALLIFGTTGCRIGSLVNLKIEDFTENGISFHTAKGDKAYVGIITSEIREQLSKVVGWRREGYVFRSKNHRVSPNAFRLRLKRYLGNDYRNPHSFRHGVATTLIDKGVDIFTVSRVLNHSSIQTTQGYVHITSKFLNKKLNGIHPMVKDKIKSSD